MDFANLHELLRSTYEEMMPLCSEMTGIAKGIAGLGALFYIALRVWSSLSRAEPIDVFPLLRPFALGFCIMFFPTIVLGTMNAVLSPVVQGTEKMVHVQQDDLQALQLKRDRLEEEAYKRDKSRAYLVDDEAWNNKIEEMGFIGPEDAITLAGMYAERTAFNAKRWFIKKVYQLLELLFHAVSLVIDTLRTFFLIVLSILGPIVGGWLTDSVSWRWTFWINLPLGVLAFIAILLVLRLPSGRLTSPIDWWGLAFMDAGAVAIVLMATWGGNQYAWTSPVIIGLGVGGLVCWGLFGFVETRATDPILPWTILTSRTFIVSTLVGMLAMGGMIGVMSYLPTYLQMVYGYSATTSGLLLVPITIGMLISSILSGVLVSRTDRYKIYPVAGPLVAAGAAFWLSRLSTTSPVWQISAATFLMGAGIGLFFQLLVTVVQNALPAKHLGTATSGNNFFREVGVSLGASLIGAAFSSGLTSNLTDRIGALARSADPAVLGELAQFKDADPSSLTPAH